MRVGVGAGLCKRRTAGFAQPIAGQTLRAIEWFDTNVTAGAPGAFNSVTGQITGGLDGGPNKANHTTRRSGGFRLVDSSEQSAGGTQFKGNHLTDSAGVQLNLRLGGWFYFLNGPRVQASNFQQFMCWTKPGTFEDGLRLKQTSATSIDVELIYNNGPGPGTTTITVGKWYWISMSVVYTSSFQWTGKAMVLPLGGSATILGAINGTGVGWDTSFRFFLQQFNQAGQGVWCGRVGAVCLHEITNHTQGDIYPAEINPPTTARSVYTINTSTGNDSNIAGPWQSLTGLQTALRWSVLKGAATPWKTAAGSDASYSTFSASDVTAKKAWQAAFDADDTSKVPQGDIVQIAPGDYFCSSETDLEYTPGLTVEGTSTTDRPTIYLDTALSSGGWSALAGTTNCYSHTSAGINNGGLYQGTTPDANGRIQRLQLRCYRGTADAAAKTYLDANPGTYCTDGTNIWLHPYGSINPTTTTIYKASLPTASSACFWIGDTLVRNINFGGGLEWATPDVTPLVVHYHLAARWSQTHGMISVVKNCRFKEYGKHALAMVTNSQKGLFSTHDIEVTNGPPVNGTPGIDFGGGSATGFVDFSGASTQSADGTGLVVQHYRPVGRNLNGVIGSATGTDSALSPPYGSHNNGGYYQFAFVGFYNQNFFTGSYSNFVPGGQAQDAFPKDDMTYDVGTESHTGTTGSASQASFSWSHASILRPLGVLVFVGANSATNPVTSVTYGGVALSAVSGGAAVDTAGEPGAMKAYFLAGTSIPTGTQTVVVNRTNNATVMYAVAVTIASWGDPEVYTSGIVLRQEDFNLTEENVSDGSPGTNSMRFAACFSGLDSVMTPGANSTAVHDIDFGTSIMQVVRETNIGQGSRPVGFTAAGSDDAAAVYLAVRDAP